MDRVIIFVNNFLSLRVMVQIHAIPHDSGFGLGVGVPIGVGLAHETV